MISCVFLIGYLALYLSVHVVWPSSLGRTRPVGPRVILSILRCMPGQSTFTHACHHRNILQPVYNLVHVQALFTDCHLSLCQLGLKPVTCFWTRKFSAEKDEASAHWLYKTCTYEAVVPSLDPPLTYPWVPPFMTLLQLVCSTRHRSSVKPYSVGFRLWLQHSSKLAENKEASILYLTYVWCSFTSCICTLLL